ncbi:uncharacterized protein LOC144613791 [Panthera onca]
MGLAAHRTPVLVELKPGESPVRIKQYPMSQEARKGIQPHIQRLRSVGVLVPCQSAWNTPLLPVKKPHTNDYQPVQDLRKVNKRVADIHPTVPNPYTLLSSLAPSRVWYTVLDLKDSFFSLPLAPQSQPLFAFEWHDPEEGYSGQLTWTRLPQGFKNSPTIFDEALHEDLVFTDTFSGWVEAYPTKHETAQTVAKKLLEDILPRYGFPAMVGSDNGPAFISQVTQAVAKAVGANWKLHCAYRPQSSGQVERMNRTLKETLTKLTMETGGDWVTLLPYALYRVRNTPYTLGFTPYEIMFGRPPPVIPSLRAELLAEFKDQELFLSLRGLQRAHEDIWPRLRAIYEAGPTPTPHQYKPGDWVYVKRHHRETLEPRWKGPYIVVLTTPTALKVDGIATWVHHTHVRPADPSSIRKDFVTRWTISRDQHNPLKLKLKLQHIRPT